MRGVPVEITRHRFWLLPERALYWPERDAVLVADLHIGKAEAFRAGALPVPEGSSQATLDRLSEVIDSLQAKNLFILGDLWHAKSGRTPRIHEILSIWRKKHQHVEMTLIEGNHDLRSGRLPAEMGIDSCPELEIEGLLLKHHPADDPRGYVLAGHIHPAVRLVGAGRQSERLPCFWFGAGCGVLPAFGEFTGSATVYPSKNDRVFVIAGDEVCEVGLTGAGSA